MKYTRSKLSKVGENLLSDDEMKRLEATAVINDWRALHMPELVKLSEHFDKLFKSHHLNVSFSSQRIKRLASIVEKLRNKPDSRLGTMQDIGGLRFVFDDIQNVLKAQELLSDTANIPVEFKLYKEPSDYIKSPKCSGYRSIHYVYELHSDNPDLDGMRFELQIRDKLQHIWAMAVETASVISQTPLKANIDDGNEWRDFFKLISAIFACRENCTVNDAFSKYTPEQYCNEYFEYKNNHHLLEQLRAIRVTTQATSDNENAGYCVLLLDFDKQVVHISYFVNEKDANELFKISEQSVRNNNKAVLMVAMQNLRDLTKAYPSFFLDTAMFFNELDAFEKTCNVH